jgi:hypothetical protein
MKGDHLYKEADQEKLEQNIPHVIEDPAACKTCEMWGSPIDENGFCSQCGGWSRDEGECQDEPTTGVKMGKQKEVAACPMCGDPSPSVALELHNPEKYSGVVAVEDVPDKREYSLVCTRCGAYMYSYTIDNTKDALKAFRDDLDKEFGEPHTYPWSWFI